MRILLINQNWFAKELRALGHEVLTCGMRPDLDYHITQSIITIDELLTKLPRNFEPDRIVWLDHSGPITVLGLENCDIPSMMYSVDTHHHYPRHSASAICFDHVCVAQKDFIHHFNSSQTPITWLPLWASEYVERSAKKKYGAVFVGTLNSKLNPQRVEFFEQLQKLMYIDVLQGHFPSIFPHAEIVLNQTVKSDLNFRVFEAMMCGALLLTERSANGLLDLFKEGTHLVTYTPRDPHDAAEKVRELLASPTIMRAIANQGRAEILARHTAVHRSFAFDTILRSLKKRPYIPERHFGAMANLVSLSKAAENKNLEASRYTSALAMHSALQALREGTSLSDDTTPQLVNACLRHDTIFRDGLGSKTISEFSEAFPHSTILSLLKLRTLLNHGKVNEARALAQLIQTEAQVEDTFLLAERAANYFIDQLQGPPPTSST